MTNKDVILNASEESRLNLFIVTLGLRPEGPKQWILGSSPRMTREAWQFGYIKKILKSNRVRLENLKFLESDSFTIESFRLV